MRPLSLDDYMALSLTQPVTASSIAWAQWDQAFLKLHQVYSQVPNRQAHYLQLKLLSGKNARTWDSMDFT